MNSTDKPNILQDINSFRKTYQVNEHQKELKDLQNIVQLRNKEILYLTTQIVAIKEEYQIKVFHLEGAFSNLKKQTADLRFHLVKTKRLEHQKVEKNNDIQKVSYQQLSQQRQEAFQLLIREQQNKWNQQIEKVQQKYQRLLRIQKNQSETFQKIILQKTKNYQESLRKCQEEKGKMFIDKRECEQKMEAYRQAVDKLKKQFKIFLQEKQEEDIKKQSKLDEYKLKQQRATKRLEEFQQKDLQKYSELKKKNEILTEARNKFEAEMKNYRNLLEHKDDEILNLTNRSMTSRQMIQPVFKNIVTCKHQGLIDQLERNIKNKDRQIENLQRKINDWSSVIGFDKPFNQRLEDIAQKSNRVDEKKNSFVKTLKARVNR